MERVGILVHPTRPVQAGVEVLERWTEAHGLELVQIPAGEQPQVAPLGTVSACDLVAALGGDGTVLKALHAAAGTMTPVMGVAFGSLGALTTVSTTALGGALDRFAEGEWQPRHLPALQLSAAGAEVAWAINDLVLSRRGGTQLVVDVFVEGELYVRLAGDGVVVATALGSSAYSMAAGGPLLEAGVNAFLCTPLAMHGGSAPPLVIPFGRQLTLELHPGYTGFDLEVDGFEVDSAARHFAIKNERSYATLADIDRPGRGLTGLRERGLISDSPRVLPGRNQR
jgi:NAD+ kinase